MKTENKEERKLTPMVTVIENIIAKNENNIANTEEALQELKVQEKFLQQRRLLNTSGKGEAEMELGKVQREIRIREDLNQLTKDYIVFCENYKKEVEKR